MEREGLGQERQGSLEGEDGEGGEHDGPAESAAEGEG
ncbi:MAG: hypothetical protein RI897_3808 [Verrucomicrobiota bacterium]